MDNLRLFNQYMGKAITTANTDEGEEGISWTMKCSVMELFEGLTGVLAESKGIDPNDHEKLEEMLNNTSGKEMMEILMAAIEEES